MSAAATALQRKDESLSDVFNYFATEAGEFFPHLKKQLLIADNNEGRAYTAISLEKKEAALNHLNNMEAEYTDGNGAFFDEGFAFIIINELIDKAELSHILEKNKMHILYLLNHELAHLAIEEAHPEGENLRDALIAECIADAYALIRHYQHFGVDSTYCDKKTDPACRAYDLVTNPDKGYAQSHFTSFVLDEIARQRHQLDVNRLSPQETADLARDFALQYAPQAPVVKTLRTTFQSVRKAFLSGTEDGIKTLYDITLNADNYPAFKLGSLWLDKYIKDRTLFTGEPIVLPKSYLGTTARQLKKRESHFMRQGFPTKPLMYGLQI